MRNLTIRVDDDVARWARVYAAQHDTSVSRIVGEMLRERMEQEQAYTQAYARWKARQPRSIKGAGSRYPTRDELHER
jgi:plasmid stability protein